MADRAAALRTLRKLLRLYAGEITTLAGVGAGEDPFRSLVATVISQRTRDAQTARASARLFEIADAPREMAALPIRAIERAIRDSGFYKQKARYIRALSVELVERFGGAVPRTLEELTSLPGVGRKTANCVLNFAYGEPAIAVDVHVHRISNRLGWVRTKTPEETERALMALIPKGKWVVVNECLVLHGQRTCLPRRPRCAACPAEPECPKRGVAARL